MLRTVTRTGHCVIYELIVIINKLQGDEMADAMDVMENAADAVDVMENAGRRKFRAAQQSVFPMEGLSPKARQDRGWNDSKLNINSDSTMIT